MAMLSHFCPWQGKRPRDFLRLSTVHWRAQR